MGSVQLVILWLGIMITHDVGAKIIDTYGNYGIMVIGESATTDCKYDIKGRSYSGMTAVTQGGLTCQAWNLTNFPDRDLKDNSNYCRNPDGDSKGPWCFTTDLTTRWQYCSIPLCTARECKLGDLGQDYAGKISKTKSGKTCQAWSSQTPHKHSRNQPQFVANFPEGNTDGASNYCRNPDGEPKGPWCYTTDPATRWQYCSIPICKARECKLDNLGRGYAGKVSKTKSDKTCQAWSSQTPHKHSRNQPQFIASFPEGDTDGASNYCRNPDAEPKGPWCYTTDPATRWQYCTVPLCSEQECKLDVLGQGYAGKISKTKSGKTCQAWSYQHLFVANFPEGDTDGASNYCRNPDGEPKGPWCYITYPSKLWEYCDVPEC